MKSCSFIQWVSANVIWFHYLTCTLVIGIFLMETCDMVNLLYNVVGYCECVCSVIQPIFCDFCFAKHFVSTPPGGEIIIFPCGSTEPTYCTLAILCPLMTHWHKKPRHQWSWYWPDYSSMKRVNDVALCNYWAISYNCINQEGQQLQA